jgi:hypothetical protein
MEQQFAALAVQVLRSHRANFGDSCLQLVDGGERARIEPRLGIVGHMSESACPSCGWDSTAGTYGVEPPFPASPACYSAYLELSAYNAERARRDFLHQEAVDAYAAHPAPPAKPISVWFALVGLRRLAGDGWTSGLSYPIWSQLSEDGRVHPSNGSCTAQPGSTPG